MELSPVLMRKPRAKKKNWEKKAEAYLNQDKKKPKEEKPIAHITNPLARLRQLAGQLRGSNIGQTRLLGQFPSDIPSTNLEMASGWNKLVKNVDQGGGGGELSTEHRARRNLFGPDEDDLADHQRPARTSRQDTVSELLLPPEAMELDPSKLEPPWSRHRKVKEYLAKLPDPAEADVPEDSLYQNYLINKRLAVHQNRKIPPAANTALPDAFSRQSMPIPLLQPQDRGVAWQDFQLLNAAAQDFKGYQQQPPRDEQSQVMQPGDHSSAEQKQLYAQETVQVGAQKPSSQQNMSSDQLNQFYAHENQFSHQQNPPSVQQNQFTEPSNKQNQFSTHLTQIRTKIDSTKQDKLRSQHNQPRTQQYQFRTQQDQFQSQHDQFRSQHDKVRVQDDQFRSQENQVRVQEGQSQSQSSQVKFLEEQNAQLSREGTDTLLCRSRKEEMRLSGQKSIFWPGAEPRSIPVSSGGHIRAAASEKGQGPEQPQPKKILLHQSPRGIYYQPAEKCSRACKHRHDSAGNSAHETGPTNRFSCNEPAYSHQSQLPGSYQNLTVTVLGNQQPSSHDSGEIIDIVVPGQGSQLVRVAEGQVLYALPVGQQTVASAQPFPAQVCTAVSINNSSNDHQSTLLYNCDILEERSSLSDDSQQDIFEFTLDDSRGQPKESVDNNWGNLLFIRENKLTNPRGSNNPSGYPQEPVARGRYQSLADSEYPWDLSMRGCPPGSVVGYHPLDLSRRGFPLSGGGDSQAGLLDTEHPQEPSNRVDFQRLPRRDRPLDPDSLPEGRWLDPADL